MVGTHRNHRLDGNDHAGLEANASPLLSIVRNVGVLVHHAANAMAHIVTKHAIAVRLGERLNGITDIPDMVTGDSLLDGSLKAIARNLAQGLVLGRGGAAMHADNLLRELIELKGGNAGAHHGSNVAERHLR